MVDFKLKRRMTKFVMLFLFIVCAFAFGEDAQQTEVLTTLEHRMQTKVSVDFRSTPIEDVIRIMASQADIDIVKSPTVTGNVTATLTDVPLEEALNNILAAHGFGYIAGKNMIRIAPFTEITEKVERLISRIYRITYADVACVEKALDKFKSPQGTISANPGTSNIIVTDIESKVKAIDTFIKEIDRITPQILVEVRIYDITSRDKLDIGIQWDAGLNTTFDEFGGTNPTGKNTPFSTGWFRGQTTKTATTTVGALRFGWLNGDVDIDVLIRAEQENTDAKLLANPRILVLDNERALFNIVTEHPYVERTITGNTVTETVKFKNVGVNLEVTPHVTRDGMVKLHIKPEFNVFVERVTLAASNVPVVDTRKADTRALVKDGHTIVLGGLRKKDVSQQTNKIPLLGDLPLIGGLFRFEGEDTATTELLVFITPRIIEKPVLSEDEKRAYEATDFSGPEQSLTRAETEAEKE
ncbi:MAG: secretin N-terminal domain-containing protein [Planctomycetota bacterium]